MHSAIPVVAILGPFVFVLALVWMKHHYKAHEHQAGALAADEKQALEALLRLGERMDQRLTTLEKILDAEDPKWRDRAA